MIQFILNDEHIRAELPPGTTLVDFIRYHRRLMGTKIGCREGDCGACTVLVGHCSGNSMVYRSATSCLMPLANAQGKHIVTVEGINPESGALTPVQQALVEESGTQCGFCTVGFVLSLTGFCLDENTGQPENAIAAIDGNICRCTGYKSIERAAIRLSHLTGGRADRPALEFAVETGIVPAYFSGIRSRLLEIRHSNPAFQPAEQPAVMVGGGTDLYVQRHDSMTSAPAAYVLDRQGLREIRELDGFIEIGGSVTVSDLLESPLMNESFPQLKEHLRLISSTPIRNMATLAGNLVNASPIGDLAVWFLALDALVVLAENESRRELPLRDFYLGYKTLAKTADELLEKVRFRKSSGSTYFNFEKVCKRTYLDIASVNSAFSLCLENSQITAAHLAVGGVAPVPLYLKKTADFLLGKNMPLPENHLQEANEILQSEIRPISDVRGSADYKRLLARQLFFAHFTALQAV